MAARNGSRLALFYPQKSCGTPDPRVSPSDQQLAKGLLAPRLDYRGYTYSWFVCNPIRGKRWWLNILRPIPCQPNTGNRHVESHIFAKFVPVQTINIVYARFKIFGTSLSVFMSVWGGGGGANVPVPSFSVRWIEFSSSRPSRPKSSLPCSCSVSRHATLLLRTAAREAILNQVFHTACFRFFWWHLRHHVFGESSCCAPEAIPRIRQFSYYGPLIFTGIIALHRRHSHVTI